MTHVTVCKPVTENPSIREKLRTAQIEIAQFNEFKRKKESINNMNSKGGSNKLNKIPQ